MFLRKKNLRRLIIAIVLGLLCFAVIDLILMVSWLDAEGIILDEGWEVETGSETVHADIPYIKIVQDEGTIVMTRSFDAQDGDDLGLVMPFVSGTAFAVDVNGEYIGGVGKIGQSTANIWYSSFVFPVENIKDGSNRITIEVYGLYDVGFHVPPYITDYQSAVRNVYIAGKLRNNLTLVLGGVSAAFGILLLISYFKNHKRQKPIFFAGLIGVLAYFTMVDCIFDVGIGTIAQLLLIKKLRFAVMFATIAFLAHIIYMNRRKRVRWIPIVIWVFTVLAFIPIAVSQSFYNWYSYMWIAFVFIGLNIGIMFYLVLTTTRYRIMHIVICIIGLLTFTQGLLSNLLGINVPSPLQFAFVLMAMVMGATYSAQMNRVFDKNKKLEIVSIKDTLTGAFNRRMIGQVRGEPGDCVTLLDIDNFKGVNDIYGHETGDAVLKEFVQELSNITRKGDAVIRLGGDEFCILLKDCPMDIAKEKMDAFTGYIRKQYRKYGIGISYGQIMYEESLEQTIIRADTLMYGMKRENKNEP